MKEVVSLGFFANLNKQKTNISGVLVLELTLVVLSNLWTNDLWNGFVLRSQFVCFAKFTTPPFKENNPYRPWPTYRKKNLLTVVNVANYGVGLGHSSYKGAQQSQHASTPFLHSFGTAGFTSGSTHSILVREISFLFSVSKWTQQITHANFYPCRRITLLRETLSRWIWRGEVVQAVWCTH